MSRAPARGAGPPDPVRRDARELYDGGGVPPEDRESAPGRDPQSHAPGESPQAFSGEFEQRGAAPGPADSVPGAATSGPTGPTGEIRAREQLREALTARLSADPLLASAGITVEIGAQGVRLHGTLRDARARARLQSLLAQAGLSPVAAPPDPGISGHDHEERT